MNEKFSIPDIIEQWKADAPTLKIDSITLNGEPIPRRNKNPFLDSNGDLKHKNINYQGMLDNPKVSQMVKSYIQTATGLEPTVNKRLKAISVSGGNIKPQSPTRLTSSNDYENVLGGGAPQSYEPSSNAFAVSTGTTGGTGGISNQSGSKIVSAAEKYVGTPYVWGGESMAEGGMDCSGFVYNALKDAGYNVGRDTAEGYRSKGITVSKSNMQPGDLIYFGNGNEATHIGIYIGNGQMVHSSGRSSNTASNPGKGVTVTSVENGGNFLEAKRLN